MRVKPLKLWALLIAAGLALSGSLSVSAQTLGDKLAKKTQAGEDDRLLVEAKEIVYDNDKNTVSAIGDAQLYYQGKVLEADKVTYDNASKRVIATGHVRMREPTGEVGYGDFMELTSDFKDGFIKSLRVIRQDQSRFAAPQAQRIDGDTTIFDKEPTRPASRARTIRKNRRSGRSRLHASSIKTKNGWFITRMPPLNLVASRFFISLTCPHLIRLSTRKPAFLLLITSPIRHLARA